MQSDIKILDNLLALNLNISLWTARRKLTPEDLGNADLPPEDLASLGSKRIADPETLKVFTALKSRAFSFLDKHGIRFMGGWAIPEDKAGIIVDELMKIRDEFTAAKDRFLAMYDDSLKTWLAKHAQWAGIIRTSVVSSDYVRSRFSFLWQLFKVQPLMGHENVNAMLNSGLAEEVTGLGNELFSEVARDANDIWQRVYLGKTEVTHKALSPLRTLQEKLRGLSFVEPHVAPVGEIIAEALQRMPKRGKITGADLLLLQGLVCMLRDGDALLTHAEAVLQGNATGNVLDTLLEGNQWGIAEDGWANAYSNTGDTLPPPPLAANAVQIQSYGLW